MQPTDPRSPPPQETSPTLSEWERLQKWLAPLVAVVALTAGALAVVSAKADRSELVKLGDKMDALRDSVASLDKSIAVSNEHLKMLDSRIDAAEARRPTRQQIRTVER
jgi:phage shock protein A